MKMLQSKAKRILRKGQSMLRKSQRILRKAEKKLSRAWIKSTQSTKCNPNLIKREMEKECLAIAMNVLG